MLSSAAGDPKLAELKVTPAHRYELQWFGKLVSAERTVEVGEKLLPS